MKKYFLPTFFAFVWLVVSACKENDPGVKDDLVQLRILNSSPYLLENIVVNTSGGENDFSSLSPNQLSTYKKFDFIYRYAYIKITIGGNELVFQPIDYVGEHKYEEGNFTYILKVDNFNTYGGLSIEFVEN